ncbi:unnamed protein product [Brassica rapa subsp. trilocularis]
MGGGVLQKFLVASMFMGMLPIAILYCFNNDLLPGSATLSPHSLTLLSGFLAVVSVNVVIVFYICVALKEPVDKHKPDASFVADAKDSVKKLTSGVSPSTDPALKKQESSFVVTFEGFGMLPEAPQNKAQLRLELAGYFKILMDPGEAARSLKVQHPFSLLKFP